MSFPGPGSGKDAQCSREQEQEGWGDEEHEDEEGEEQEGKEEEVDGAMDWWCNTHASHLHLFTKGGVRETVRDTARARTVRGGLGRVVREEEVGERERQRERGAPVLGDDELFEGLAIPLAR
jgi:hypothetical protein